MQICDSAWRNWYIYIYMGKHKIACINESNNKCMMLTFSRVLAEIIDISSISRTSVAPISALHLALRLSKRGGPLRWQSCTPIQLKKTQGHNQSYPSYTHHFLWRFGPSYGSMTGVPGYAMMHNCKLYKWSEKWKITNENRLFSSLKFLNILPPFHSLILSVFRCCQNHWWLAWNIWFGHIVLWNIFFKMDCNWSHIFHMFLFSHS